MLFTSLLFNSYKGFKFKISIFILFIFLFVHYSQASESDSIVNSTDSLIITPTINSDSNFLKDESLDSSLSLKTLKQAKLLLFVHAGFQFTNFQNRQLFVDQLEEDYQYLLSQSQTNDEKNLVRTQRQDYQKVNTTFPIFIGFCYHPWKLSFVSIAMGYWHSKENAIITNRLGQAQNHYYAIQAFPIYAEWKFLIPATIATITDNTNLSVSVRWYWVGKGTEIYNERGTIKSESSLRGNGAGFFLGYQISKWKGLILEGNLGYSIIKTSSAEKWNELLPFSKNDNHAKWQVGGLGLELKAAAQLF